MEFVPRQLRRSGRLNALRSVLENNYTHVLDLRVQPQKGKPNLRPLESLTQLAGRYRRSFTDLLVLRC